MPVEIVPALIAAAGVIIAAAVSYITSQRQARIEIQKFRAETQRDYGGKLLEKRLEVYPELYSYISDFIKLMRYGEISSAALRELFNRFQEWDTKNAILFSAFTHGVCSPVRHQLGALSEKSDEELRREFQSWESKNALKKELQKVELALRHELGVFAFESPLDVEEQLERQLSYEAAHARSGL